MDSEDVIVSDDSIFRALSSDDLDLLECGQLIIEFLTWRGNCKKIVTIPKIYNSIYAQVKDHGELRAYFENYFESATFIGMSEKNPDDREFYTLLFSLYLGGNLMIFVSNDSKLLGTIKEAKVPKTVFKTIHEFRSFLQSKKDFWDFIFYKYYDSSA
ncbi:hypothetical protein HYU07_05995 [Candidatus Woesearchaeota archaeon]|nr:hypothetical protein [Candidatus Woesearchaeota archaeon]